MAKPVSWELFLQLLSEMPATPAQVHRIRACHSVRQSVPLSDCVAEFPLVAVLLRYRGHAGNQPGRFPTFDLFVLCGLSASTHLTDASGTTWLCTDILSTLHGHRRRMWHDLGQVEHETNRT